MKEGKRLRRWEGRGQMTEVRGQMTEVRGQRTEVRGQMTEDRSGKLEFGRREIVSGFPIC
jgi:hypothetical protein